MEKLGGFLIEDFEDRVRTQKTIYLLQVLGIDLRFRFSWYLRGPFSRSLSHAVYQIDETVKERASELSLRPQVMPVVEKVKEIIAQKPDSLDETRWLELVASVHYLIHISRVGGDIDQLERNLKSRGKVGFSLDEIKQARDWLAELELLENKTRNLVASSE
jgi:uncharacterized protein YwgA